MINGWRLLVFGASGAIGGGVIQAAIDRGWSVTAVTRSEVPAETRAVKWVTWNPLTDCSATVLADASPFNAVCWAQGQNFADAIDDFDPNRHLDLYRANVLMTLQSAAFLLSHGLLAPSGARMVVLSSIWQERARDRKLSYIISKAALGGLVRSLSVDLGRHGHLINAVLPGVTDTPMTRANLSDAQIAAIIAKTTLGRLPDLDTLAGTVLFLASAANKSISGQSITVDLGMSNVSLF